MTASFRLGLHTYACGGNAGLNAAQELMPLDDTTPVYHLSRSVLVSSGHAALRDMGGDELEVKREKKSHQKRAGDGHVDDGMCFVFLFYIDLDVKAVACGKDGRSHCSASRHHHGGFQKKVLT